MSTATAEAPVEQAKVEAIPPTNAERDAMVAMFTKPKTTITSVVQPTAKVEPEKTEPPKEVEKASTEVSKQAEVATAPKSAETTPPTSDKETNLANLRKAREEAEARAKQHETELQKLREEYESYKKNPIPKEVEERLTKAEQERAEYQQRLRAADLARDPEFQQKYNTPIKSAMSKMVATAIASGIPKADAERAVASWDRTAFAEWADTMPAVEKFEFGAAMQRAIELYDSKEAEIQNAEVTWTELQKKRQQEQELQLKNYHEILSKDVDGTIKELAETELGKAHEDVAKEAAAVIRRAAGLDGQRLTNRELLGMAGKSVLLAKAFQVQETKLTERDTKIAELEKKLAEQEAFIKGEASSTPGISSGVSKSTVTDQKALVSSFLNPKVGV